ncbi:MAG: LysR family transcriptional regulator [Planctomycetota bacterium]|nr:LysR family transcriptional regulator [Planctomycetota bacterium]
MIQISRLEGFFWVARTGGYARAARAFPYPISQPAVHQQVRKLERELETPLFERVAKDRVRLTPAGRHLFDFVAPFYEGLPAVERSIRGAEHGGEIHIHAASLLLRDLLPAWVKRLKRKCPQAEIHLREAQELDPALLRRGEADLLISHMPDLPDDIASRRVGTLHGYVVVPRGHRLARRKRISLRDLAGETFIGYSPELMIARLQMHALAEAGVEPARTISAGTAQTILAFVEAGLGVSAFATVDPAGPRRQGVVALRLRGKRFDFPIHMAWRKHAPANPALEAALATAPAP